MEKYIKVLENYIDEYIEPYIFENDNYDELDEMREAIENLIKGYRELKEQFKKVIEYRQLLEKDLFENSSNYVISKDKIREKIEKIQILIDEYEENEKSSKYKVDNSYWHENKMRYVHKRNILKELLEE